jgi:pentatricopeptide repeat protein
MNVDFKARVKECSLPSWSKCLLEQRRAFLTQISEAVTRRHPTSTLSSYPEPQPFLLYLFSAHAKKKHPLFQYFIRAMTFCSILSRRSTASKHLLSRRRVFTPSLRGNSTLTRRDSAKLNPSATPFLRRTSCEYGWHHPINPGCQQHFFSSQIDDKSDDVPTDEEEVEIVWANKDEANTSVDNDAPPPLFTIDESTPEKTDFNLGSVAYDVATSFHGDNSANTSPPTLPSPLDDIDFGDSKDDNVNLETPDASSSLDNTTSIETESSDDISDLFSADIFAESWQGKTVFDTTPRESTSSTVGKFGMFNTDMFAESRSDKPEFTSFGNRSEGTPVTSFGEGSPIKKEISYSPIENPTTAIEKRYNDLLEQTNDLLTRLSGEGPSTTTLQLMDFDKVMVQWSQFHSEIDRNKEESDSVKADLFDFSSNLYETNKKDLTLRASDNCIRLLNALEKSYDDAYQCGATEATKHMKVFPNAASFNHALYSLAHSCKGAAAAQEAYLMLHRMLDRCRQYRDSEVGVSSNIAAPPEPTVITFNSVVHAIAKSGATDAGFLAEDVFDLMEAWKKECDDKTNKDGNERSQFQYRGVYPNAKTFASVLDAWANAETIHGQSLVPERTTCIIEAALDRRRAYVRSVKGLGDKDHILGDDFVNEQDEANEPISIVDTAKENDSLDDGIVEEIIEEDFFDEDIDLSESKCSSDAFAVSHVLSDSTTDLALAEPFLKPNIVAINTVLNAWSLSGLGYQGAMRAHELLNRVEHLLEGGDLDLPDGHQDPTITSFDIDDGHAMQSLKPNVRSYSTVMNVLANVASVDSHHGEEAASKCEQLLTKMEQQSADDASIRPNLVTYTTCITAWARARESYQAPARAENILNRMIDLYYDEGSELPTLENDMPHFQHDAPFNAVITAYARSGHPAASDRALAILDRLETSPVEPTATTFNAVMDACAKNGEPERALSVLKRMKERNIQPDPTSYDTIINAFSRVETAGAADRAWEFLQQLEEDTLNGRSDFVATNISYSSVINAYARASGKSKEGIRVAEKAKEVYDHMIQQIENGKLQGNVDAFANSCLLNCCANVNGPSAEKRAALIIAITAFEDLKKSPSIHGEINQYTFGTMMKVSNKLSSDPDEKTRLMESLFVQACNRGCLSSSVLGQFLKHVPSHISTKAILSQGGTKRTLPAKWYRNVPEKHWPRGFDGPQRISRHERQRKKYANDY